MTETQKNDLLSVMLYERDDYFTDQLVKDSAFTFLLAGHETTATALPGVLMYLAKVLSNFIYIPTVFLSLDFFHMNLLKSRLSKIAQVQEMKITVHTICCRTVKIGYYFQYHSPGCVQKKRNSGNCEAVPSFFF